MTPSLRRYDAPTPEDQTTKRTLCAVGLAALCLAWAAPARAAVLCQKRSGAVFVRAACKKKETALNLAQFACPPDSVLVGTTCVDTYEASVWQIVPSNTALVQKVQQGTVTLADLRSGGATEISPDNARMFFLSCYPGFPATFPASGNWTAPLYAVSVAGVQPTACITWFQAEQACALSGKRLLTNQEWQRAAAGTPDPGFADDGSTTCNTASGGASVNTGSRSNCKSTWGVFDMVGNVSEWVADWVPLSTVFPSGCTWGSFSDDRQCFRGADTSSQRGPGALVRGGSGVSVDGTDAGVFAVEGFSPPESQGGGGGRGFTGFRCAR